MVFGITSVRLSLRGERCESIYLCRHAFSPRRSCFLCWRRQAHGQAVTASSNVGYIDDAIVQTRLRLRFDAAYDNNRPDRAEFFYAKCGCFPRDWVPIPMRQARPRR